MVDGGHASSSLAPALMKQLGAETVHLDVVICTHNDDDHAGGLIDLADHTGITISEFWLPGSWSDVVKDVVDQTALFYKELVKEATDKNAERLRGLSSDDDQEVDRELAKLTSNIRIPDDQATSKGAANLDLHPWPQFNNRSEATKAKRAITKQSRDPVISKRAKDLIEAAEKIRKIALSAYSNNVPVRWFDYLAYSRDRKAAGGDPNLRPVNAKELVHPPSVSPFVEFRRFVTLSRVNRESLVFISTGDDAHVDVLFCGDSPLGDEKGFNNSFLTGMKTRVPLIATAPHHGAEANKVAYKHIDAFADVAFWVRSGGKSHHPGSTFRHLPAAQRTCTHCPHKGLPHQSVVITDMCQAFSDPEAWLTVRSHDCSC